MAGSVVTTNVFRLKCVASNDQDLLARLIEPFTKHTSYEEPINSLRPLEWRQSRAA